MSDKGLISKIYLKTHITQELKKKKLKKWSKDLNRPFSKKAKQNNKKQTYKWTKDA